MLSKSTPTTMPRSAKIEFPDFVDDVLQFFPGEVLVGWQRDRVAAVALAYREIALPVSPMRRSGLEVQRDRIVDLSRDAGLFQMSEEPVPILGQDDVSVVDLFHPRVPGRYRQKILQIRKSVVVEARILDPPLRDGLDLGRSLLATAA